MLLFLFCFPPLPAPGVHRVGVFMFQSSCSRVHHKVKVKLCEAHGEYWRVSQCWPRGKEMWGERERLYWINVCVICINIHNKRALCKASLQYSCFFLLALTFVVEVRQLRWKKKKIAENDFPPALIILRSKRQKRKTTKLFFFEKNNGWCCGMSIRMGFLERDIEVRSFRRVSS